MAQKRMFDKAIIDTDRFMDMSMSAKALYFLLGMEADDEGFVSYKKVMRVHGGNEDDVKILVAKSFLISFPSGVVVVTDWNKNNYMDKNRIRPTEYQKEKSMLRLTKSKEYEFNDGLTSIEERRGEERSIEEDQDTAGSFERFWKTYPKKMGKKMARKAWDKLKMTTELESRILGSLTFHMKSSQWVKDAGQFIPHASTWLNQERWEDEIKVVGAIPSSAKFDSVASKNI